MKTSVSTGLGILLLLHTSITLSDETKPLEANSRSYPETDDWLPGAEYWVYSGIGYPVSSISINRTMGRWGLGLTYGSASREGPFLSFDSYIDRDTGESLSNTGFQYLGATRSYKYSGSWWFLNTELGISYVNGTWTKNCDRGEPGFLGTQYKCDKADMTSPGLLIGASANIAKSFGVGLYWSVLVTQEVSIYSGGINIPLVINRRQYQRNRAIQKLEQHNTLK
jgi:hypothetical protein